MGAPRLRKVSSRKELEDIVDDFMTQGYEVIEEGQRTKLLRKKSWGSGGGHIICALLTVWFTLGVGNVIYALIAHYNAPKVLIKLED